MYKAMENNNTKYLHVHHSLLEVSGHLDILETVIKLSHATLASLSDDWSNISKDQSYFSDSPVSHVIILLLKPTFHRNTKLLQLHSQPNSENSRKCVYMRSTY